MSDKNSAVGVFDSGLGGLTAIKQLKRILPNENFIYFGDTGRVPYGTRSFETVLQYADDDMRFLMNYDIKAAVVACGTVSAIALPTLKENFHLPIIDAITPACKKAASVTKTGKVAVFATQATVKRGAFEEELKKNSSTLSVYPIACPMFVPLIEGGYIARNCEVTRLIAKEYISHLKGTGADTLILGCTHYPIIKELIEDKSLLLIDDSIVRGTQLGETTDFLYQSGAKEVHIRPACPPIMFGCKYLNFSRSKSELDLITRRIIREREGDDVSDEVLKDYANPDSQNYKEMVEEVRKRLNFTSLKYHRLDDMIETIGLPECKLCTYCWNGKE